MAWGPSDSRQEDLFDAAEREIKAVVSASWWPTARAEQREHAVAGRVVELPDATQWLFGAWARWYRKHPGDNQWYLCPPPYATSVRRSGKTAAAVSGLPPHVIPLGPDFEVTAPAALPFFGADLAPLTARVRATVESAASLPPGDFPRPENPPRWLADFSPDAPNTVAACWGVMLWCASAPVFDAQRDADLLALWEPYRAAALPRIEGPRWLTPPTLEDLVSLYAERLRAHNVQSAVVILRTMWATASALRDEPRFTARADALLAILNVTLADPQQDYGALPHGDAAVAQLWVTRCPPNLSPGLRAESSPGDGFRHLFYDLARCLAPAAGEPGGPTFVEPRLIAAALLAADLAIVRQDLVAEVTRWLDPEIRYTVQAMIAQPGHPLRRRFWPIDQRLPPQLRDGASGNGEELLAVLYAVALGWCRLGGGIPARPRGFPAPVAVLAELVGLERATATTPAAPPPPPQQWGAPPQQGAPQQGAPFQPGASQQGAPLQPGMPQPGAPQQGEPPQPGMPQPGTPFQQGAPQPGASQQGAPQQWGPPQQPHVPPGAQGGQQPAQGQPWGTQPHQRTARAEFGPDGQLILPGQDARPAEPGAQGEQAQFGQPGAPYQTGSRRPAAQRGPTADELAQQAGKAFGKAWERARKLGGRLLGGGPQADVHSTGPLGFDQPDGPRQPPMPSPAGADPGQGGQQAPEHGTRVMSGTMVGNFLDYAPVPSRPVDDIAPPARSPGEVPTVTRRGVTFVYGAEDDAAAFLDALPVPGIALDATQVAARPGPNPRAPQAPATMLDQSAAALLEASGAPASFDPRATMLDPGTGGAVEGPTQPDQGQGFDPRATMLDPSGGRPVDSNATRLDQGAGQPAGQDAARPVDPDATLLDQGAGRPVDSNATLLDQGAGRPVDPNATLLDQGGARPADPYATMLDGGAAAGPAAGPAAVSVLLVGAPHTGQRRFARMIAGIVGDGQLRVIDAEELRGLALERLATLFDEGGQGAPTLLLERLDAAVLDAADPQVFLRTLRTVRARARVPMVTTCDPRSFRRFAQEHPELERVFRVFHLPELRDVEERVTLLRVLADERRASLDTVAWDAAREDLTRLRGPGDLTGARLVEAYLDRAYQRALGRGGGARDRVVLQSADFAGVPETIEPALRPAGDVDGYLDTLHQMIGLVEVKAEVDRLAAEADAPVNLVFEGPPGTGKATVAGIVGGIFGALGVLPSGHLIQCRPEHLLGRDGLETELRTAAMVQQAEGGLLLVQQAEALTPEAVAELFRGFRDHPYQLVLAGRDLGGFLRANPDIEATFLKLDFTPPTDRELVQLFVKLAEAKLYVVEEELRVELMTRIAGLRENENFAYGRTVHQWFDETVARQARRLAGLVGADAMTAARLTTRDLPESNLERVLGDLNQTLRGGPEH
ncbi:hypothetical protein [Actinocorallia populi]|uniref:hypothetical protein n=1 Tax=Actinocorallia populi TaxID=2079200 RepID=UPI000D092866|nr:hypothetical protein [Actinocorallia populi]